MPLGSRARRILATLVTEYIQTGEPVASQTVMVRGGFELSSATIRHVLAQLEEDGYVHQPHTSAGRVPTDLGYRCYVNMLLESRRPGRPAAAVEAQLRLQTGSAPLLDQVLSTASHVLSQVSHHLGFAIAPDADVAQFQRIDFVLLADTTTLVIVVAGGGQVSQKVVDIGEALNSDELRQAASYLNASFRGLPLSQVRGAVIQQMREERALYDILMARALRLALSALEKLTPQPTLYVDGASSLVADEAGLDFSLGALRKLLHMIEEKHRLIRLLTEYIEGPGLRVAIGGENRSPDLQECSVVTATYVDHGRVGTVGVLGPTRMRYSRAISVVDGMATAVSRVFEGTLDVRAD